MKKTLMFTALLSGLGAASTAAVAQGVAADAETEVTIQAAGSLDKRCTIYTGVTPMFTNLDLESLEIQGSGSLVVSCNYTGGTTVTFTSANAGVLVNENGDALPYGFGIDGSANAPGNSPLELFEPLVETDLFNVSADLLNDPALATDERALSVQLIETAVIAGTYTDTITATLSPN